MRQFWWLWTNLDLSQGLERKNTKKPYRVIRLNGPEGGKGPLLTILTHWCQHHFLPKSKPGSLWMMTPSYFFFTPMWRQPQILMMLHSNFFHIISSGLFGFFLGLLKPLIWFTCCCLPSQFSQRDTLKYHSLIFKSSHWLPVNYGMKSHIS